MRQRREPPQHHRPLTLRRPSHTAPCCSAVTAHSSALHARVIPRFHASSRAPHPSHPPTPRCPSRIAPPHLRTFVISFGGYSYTLSRTAPCCSAVTAHSSRAPSLSHCGGYSYTLCTPRPIRSPIPRFLLRIAPPPLRTFVIAFGGLPSPPRAIPI